MRMFTLALGTYSEKTVGAFEISMEVSTQAQAVFMDQRKKEVEEFGKVKTDDSHFHRYLTLSRYLSCAKGASKLTHEVFLEAKKLDDVRNERVTQINAKNEAKKALAADNKQVSKESEVKKDEQ